MLPLLLAAAISYTLHAKDIFQPPKAPAIEGWKAEGAKIREPIEFDASEGYQLRGWVYKSDRPDAPFVLFFYGSNEDLSHEGNRLAWLRDNFHVNAVSFDYPGYGFSRGTATVGSLFSAALQEFDYVRNHLAPAATPIVSYGWSIGTGIAIHVAAERRTVAGLILQAPPASSQEMAQWSSRHDVPRYARAFVKVRVDPSVLTVYEGVAGIRRITSPLLVIHGSVDDAVPVEQGREVFAASPATQKRFVEVPGAHHNDLRFTQAPASGAVAEFLGSVSLVSFKRGPSLPQRAY